MRRPSRGQRLFCSCLGRLRVSAQALNQHTQALVRVCAQQSFSGEVPPRSSFSLGTSFQSFGRVRVPQTVYVNAGCLDRGVELGEPAFSFSDAFFDFFDFFLAFLDLTAGSLAEPSIHTFLPSEFRMGSRPPWWTPGP